MGTGWLALTVVFEFGFGRLVAKQSWDELLADYNVARAAPGRLCLRGSPGGRRWSERFAGVRSSPRQPCGSRRMRFAVGETTIAA